MHYDILNLHYSNLQASKTIVAIMYQISSLLWALVNMYSQERDQEQLFN